MKSIGATVSEPARWSSTNLPEGELENPIRRPMKNPEVHLPGVSIFGPKIWESQALLETTFVVTAVSERPKTSSFEGIPL
jgi:hypothetical protein